MTGPNATIRDERRDWISVLARAPFEEIAAAWYETDAKPDYRVVRGPESGLAMVQGRMGGTGARFNLGEMTLSRCVVETRDGRLGVAYVAGLEPRHAEYAAVFDVMLQDERRRPALQQHVIDPMRRRLDDRRRAADVRTAATRVEFFTLVRGEDE